MGERDVIASQEKYQRWVWRIHPQCVVCKAQHILNNDSAECTFKVPIGAMQQCLYMTPKEATTK